MGAKASERNRITRLSRTTPDTAGSLRVVCGGGRDVSHEDSSQVADVNAKLERGSATEHIDFAFDEFALNLPCLLRGKLSCVLLDVQG